MCLHVIENYIKYTFHVKYIRPNRLFTEHFCRFYLYIKLAFITIINRISYFKTFNIYLTIYNIKRDLFR